MLTALTNATIFTGYETVSGKALLVEDDLIAGIVNNDVLPSGADNIDCTGMNISPGLIDLQIAGSGGFLFSASPTREALDAITESILRSGTTGFLIAMPTNYPEVYSEAFRVMKEYHHPALLGLHLEGPYVSIAKRGAHVRELIRRPDKNDVLSLLEEAGGMVKMMTVAPEVCTPEIISVLREHGVVVAAGHSNATFTEAVAGFENGVETVTHLFNAMSPIHHRDPGLPGAVFNSDTACASIIADGIHVDYSMLAISKKIMKERLFLVSDAVEENDRGAYQHVRQRDRFSLPDGTLSGANLTLMQALRNCTLNAGIETDEALRMASAYPARLMNLHDRGYITKGARADLVVFTGDFTVKMVIVGGKITGN